MSNSVSQIQEEFQRLVDIIAALRDPDGGCPWDLEQTHESLTPYLIEETYEAVESIESSDGKLAEELGDVLLQVLLHSQIANEAGEFSIFDVVRTLNEKLIRRHPHVFGETDAKTVQKVLANWEVIKAEEKRSAEAQSAQGSSEKMGMLSGLPQALPALQRSHRIGEKVARVGFDWDGASEVFEKVSEELDELRAELDDSHASSDAVAEELGDVLFSLAQFARLLGLNAEEVLRSSNRKFQRRFEQLELSAKRPLQDLKREDLEALWVAVKEREQSQRDEQ